MTTRATRCAAPPSNVRTREVRWPSIRIKGAFARTPLGCILRLQLAHLDERRREEQVDVHAKRFQVCSCVQDATALHASCGKVLADAGRESSQVVLIRELLEGAEGDKHPCKRIRVEVSRMLGHESGPASEHSEIRLYYGCCVGRVQQIQFAVDPAAGLFNRATEATVSAAGPGRCSDSRWCVFLQGEEMQLSVRSGVAGGAGLSLGCLTVCP